MIAALATLLGCFAGFAAFAYAMDKHHREMTGALPKGRNLRPFAFGGWIVLALAALPLVLMLGIAVGLTFWIGLLMLGALGVGMMLTYRPRLLPMTALLALPLSLCAAVLSGVS